MNVYYILQMSFYGSLTRMERQMATLQEQGEEESVVFNTISDIQGSPSPEEWRQQAKGTEKLLNLKAEQMGKFHGRAEELISSAQNINDNPDAKATLDAEPLSVAAPKWTKPGEEVTFHVESRGKPVINAEVKVGDRIIQTDREGNASITLYDKQSYDVTVTKDGFETVQTLLQVREPRTVSTEFENIQLGQVSQDQRITKTEKLDNTGETTIRIASVTADANGVSASATTKTAAPGESIAIELEVDTSQIESGFFAKNATIRWEKPQGTTNLTVTGNVTRKQLPTAEFTLDPVSPTTGKPVEFNAGNSVKPGGTITTYEWDFDGDGQTDTTTSSATTTHTYDKAGSYTVTLTITDDESQTAEATRTVTVKSDSESQPSDDLGLLDEFEDGTYTDEWRVLEQDDETIKETNGRLRHKSPRAYNSGGNMVSKREFEASGTKTITVRQKSASRGFWSFGFKLSFENARIKLKDSKWGSNDRLRLALPNSKHNLDTATDSTDWQNYSMTIDFDAMTVESVTRGDTTYDAGWDISGIQSDTFQLEIGDGRGHNTLYDAVWVSGAGSDTGSGSTPDATFITSSSTADVDESVTFDASGSTDPDGTITTYKWDFDGDGQTDATGQKVTHTFESAGEYAVTLTVTDASENTATTTETISVTDSDDSSSLADFRETASLTGSQTTPSSLAGKLRVESPTAPDTSVELLRSSSTNYSLAITAPDSATNVTFYLQKQAVSASQNVENLQMYLNGEQHNYTVDEDAGPGNSPWIAFQVPHFSTRTVSFTTDTSSLGAQFDYTPDQPLENESITFNASASTGDTIAAYEWDFNGDGLIDNRTTTPTTTYTYTSPGQYATTLTVVDANGQTAQTSQPVTVNKRRLDIEVSPSKVTVGTETTVDVTVTDASTGLGIDGATVLLSEPSGVQLQTDQSGFAAAIVEPTTDDNITVIASKEGYPNATATLVVTPSGSPTASVFTSLAEPTAGTAISFNATGSSDPDGTIQTYRWDFNNDGLTDRRTSSPTVTHTFEKAGNYTVGLTVVDDSGATAAATTTITVAPVDQASIDPTRTLPSSVSPGEKATIRVQVNASSSSVNIQESFEPTVANATIDHVRVNGVPVPTLLRTANDDGVVVTVEGVQPGDTVTVQYTVSVPNDAAGTVYTIGGNVSADQTVSTGTDQLTVSEGIFQGAAAQYNANGDDTISIQELGNAASDYVQDKLSITELGTVASAYVRT